MVAFRYPLEQSPLFRLQTMGALGRLLKVESPRTLAQLERRNREEPEKFYHRHQSGTRDVQSLRGILNPIHRRLYGLLSRLSTPPYLVSSQPGLSYVDNARRHQSVHLSILGLDIKKFYARTRHSAVLHFFLNRLQMAADVAHLLANLCCYQGKRLPMGSPISQPLAYWAHESLFEDIARYATSHGFNLSVSIDDLTLSYTSPVPRKTHLDIQSILVAHGMTLHWRKIHYRPAGQPREVTGCVITKGGDLEAPLALQKKTRTAISRFRAAPTLSAGARVLGLIQAVRAIVPENFDRDRLFVRSEIKRLRKKR